MRSDLLFRDIVFTDPGGGGHESDLSGCVLRGIQESILPGNGEGIIKSMNYR